MFGDVAAWMMAALAGIRPDDDAPGFRRTIIERHPVAGRALEPRPDLRVHGHDRDRLVVEVGSGSYRFAARDAKHP